MQILSVNIGHERTLQNGRNLETTGIYKIASIQPVEVNTLGLKDDFIFSSKHHGGPDQAVYIYGSVDYDWWSKELDRQLAPGTFGENLTISDLESAVFAVGDRLHVGQVVLEVTSPRIPCGTLAARMGDPLFVKRYRQAERPGLYCRVIQQGELEAGDDVSLTKFVGDRLSILEVFRGYYEKEKSKALIERYLQAPIAIRVRTELEQELKRFLEQY